MSLEAVEQKFDARLTSIAQNIDFWRKRQQEFNFKKEQRCEQVKEVEKMENRLEKMFELLEDDFKHIVDETGEVQRVVENSENSLWKNNLRVRGLKEGAEGGDLKKFLENLFMACIGSSSNVEVKLKFVYRLRNLGRGKGRDKDREVLNLIGFEDRFIKTIVVDVLWDQPKIVVEGQELTFYSD